MRIGTIIKTVFFLLALGVMWWFYQEWSHQRDMIRRGQEVSLHQDRDPGPALKSALGIRKGDRRLIRLSSSIALRHILNVPMSPIWY